MKRISRTFVIMLLVMMMSPLTAFAVPGFLEINITTKNFRKYFEFVTIKDYDKFGDFEGYKLCLKSKLLDKGYYLYCDSGNKYVFKYTATVRYSKNGKKYTRKISDICTDLGFLGIYNTGKSDKVIDFKITKSKGKLVFIKPSNVIGVEKEPSGILGDRKIMFRQPYNEDTLAHETHPNGRRSNSVIDYYYYYPSYDGSNYSSNGKNFIFLR